MEYLTRGKRLLTFSLKENPALSKKKRINPCDDAKFWCETGLDKEGLSKKFRCLCWTRFPSGGLLLEYAGDRISPKEALLRSKSYAKRCKDAGRWYIYHYNHSGREHCVDASNTYHRLCRYVNDSSIKDPLCNSKMKLKVFNNDSRLCLFAIKDIKAGDEIRYDYGEDGKLLFWRKEIQKNERRNLKRSATGDSDDCSDLDDDPFDVERDRCAQQISVKNDELEQEENTDEHFTQKSDEQLEDKTQAVLDDLWRQDHSQDATPVVQIGPYVIRKSSFHFLKNSLSDELMDGYMTLLVQGKNVLYIDCINATNIFEGRPEQTGLLRDIILERYDSCLAVVNEGGGHWILLIIDPKEHQITYLNSLGEHQAAAETYLEHWFNFLNKRCQKGLDVSPIQTWTLSTMPHSKQMDSCSCGLFVLKFAECYLKRQPLVVSQSMDKLRRYVGVKILSYGTKSTTSSHNASDDSVTDMIEVSDPCTLEYIHTSDESSLSVASGETSADNMDMHDTMDVSDPCDLEYVQSSSESSISVSSGKTSTSSEGGDSDTGLSVSSKNAEECTDEYAARSNIQGNEHIQDSQGKSSFESGLQCNICSRVFKHRGALTTHLNSHTREVAGTTKYKKPKRVCPVCGKEQSKLTRHLKQHGDVPKVKKILDLPRGSEKKEALNLFRKSGIFQHNRKEASKEAPGFIGERKGLHELLCCSKCKGFYSRKIFYRHKRNCSKEDTKLPIGLSTTCFDFSDSDTFAKEILAKFQHDDAGEICRTDPFIIMIGRKQYKRGLKKVDKDMERKKSVMNDMRLLARLLLAFRRISTVDMAFEDMFKREHFTILEEAIDAVSKPGDKLKHGVKNALKCILHISAEALSIYFQCKNDDGRSDKIDKFIRLLKFNDDYLFSDAAYAVNLSRQEKLRMPEQQANEKDIKLLSKYVQKKIIELISPFLMVGRHEFIELRDCICCRLTLFNARRGGEPSRLKLSQYDDAINQRWLNAQDVERVPKWEKQLFKDLIIAYQPGKGNHLVPLLIPSDCRRGLEILANITVRLEASVHKDNPYLFPNTENSPNHVSGWSTINHMCVSAGVTNPHLLTATKQRHRISTLYSSIDVDDVDREFFYKHMGHSRAVNMGTYQYPLPMMEITKVGKHLQAIDAATLEPNESFLQDHASGTDIGNKREQTSNDEAVDSSYDCTETQSEKQPVHIKAAPGSTNECTDTQAEQPQLHETAATGRSYIRWTHAETNLVITTFKDWINMPEGNCLPSADRVSEFLRRNQMRCTYVQLRTKIMNEQNKRQRQAKARMEKMML